MQSHQALVQRRQLDEISELPAALGCLDTEAGRHDQAASRLLWIHFNEHTLQLWHLIRD